MRFLCKSCAHSQLPSNEIFLLHCTSENSGDIRCFTCAVDQSLSRCDEELWEENEDLGANNRQPSTVSISTASTSGALSMEMNSNNSRAEHSITTHVEHERCSNSSSLSEKAMQNFNSRDSSSSPFFILDDNRNEGKFVTAYGPSSNHSPIHSCSGTSARQPFTIQDVIFNHENLMSENLTQKSLCCELCGKVLFNRVQQLNNNQPCDSHSDHHSNNNNLIDSSEIPSSYVADQSLPLLRLSDCPVCDKCFEEFSNLRYHANTFCGTRPFRCPFKCGAAFKNEVDLSCHRIKHLLIR